VSNMRHALILAQGDPGLGSLLKRIGKGVAGLVTGGPLGAVAGLMSSQGPKGVARLPAPGQIPRPGAPGTMSILSVPGVTGALQQFVPGGATGLMAMAAPGGGACPKGYHPNKSGYMTRGGYVAAGVKCVRNRRRNLSNGRANTRALSRMAAWEKQDKRRRVTLRKIARSAG
jgi:hypothetical protein